nr:hypothetical protein [Tanacetum cinerariifolium]
LDPLGKFQGKVDEGFLIGYSVCSSGPAWLFDIDSLSQTMNYHPVIAENQTNSNAGFQDTKKAEEEGTQTYVLFPMLSDGSINSQNNNKDALVDGKEHDDDIQKSVSPDIHSSSSGAQTRKQGDKAENKDKGKSPVVTITGFRDLNAEFEECNKAIITFHLCYVKTHRCRTISTQISTSLLKKPPSPHSQHGHLPFQIHLFKIIYINLLQILIIQLRTGRLACKERVNDNITQGINIW